MNSTQQTSPHDSAMVVLSGGQDSTTVLFWAKRQFKNVYAISFDYGQRHAIELESARTVARMAEVEHEIVDIRGLLRSTSPLTSDNELEKYDNFDQMQDVIGNRVELTFVPMRNTLFFTIATNYALAKGCRNLVTGICQEDNANYPDCTESFRSKLEDAFNQSLFGASVYGAVHGITIYAPLMNLSKADTVRLAMSTPGAMEALAYSHTSYDGKYPPTDNNHSNVLRAHGFEEAGVADPLVLRAWREGLMELPPTSNYDSYR